MENDKLLFKEGYDYYHINDDFSRTKINIPFTNIDIMTTQYTELLLNGFHNFICPLFIKNTHNYGIIMILYNILSNKLDKICASYTSSSYICNDNVYGFYLSLNNKLFNECINNRYKKIIYIKWFTLGITINLFNSPEKLLDDIDSKCYTIKMFLLDNYINNNCFSIKFKIGKNTHINVSYYFYNVCFYDYNLILNCGKKDFKKCINTLEIMYLYLGKDLGVNKIIYE